ncbi:hypothetical protein NMY22_g6916 [Coprinellus aureogranulatus]|nr:hypothetical protein NMY22_g6916 [Coprinellus aureogranulatus]
MSVAEFSGLVAVVLADQPSDNSYVPEFAAEIPAQWHPVPPCSLPSSSPSTPPRSFLPPIPRSASLFDTLAHLLPTSTVTQRASAPTTPVHGHALKRRQNTYSTPTRPSGARTVPTTPGMPSTNDLEYPYRMSTLDMGSASPSGSRKPLALLSKFKKQASALVKNGSASISNGSPKGASANEHSLMGDNLKTAIRYSATSTPEKQGVPTVSFAPTPVPSMFTPTRTSTSSSYMLSRTSTSDANSSFLECEDRRSFRMSTSKLKNTFFKNRNTHLNESRSQQDLNFNESQLSIATGATTETATDSAFSTESSDCIPYIPFVLPGQELPALPEAPQARYSQRLAGPPSPTPSCSTAESTSTRFNAPHTPLNPLTAAADGSFTVTAISFNGGVDGSRQMTAQVSANGQGTNFVAATVTKNGDRAPNGSGNQQITAKLPANTKCTGGSSGNKCLVQFKSAAGFGNCVVVQQGGAAAGNARQGANARQGGTRAARAMLAEIAERGEEAIEVVKRKASQWIWA